MIIIKGNRGSGKTTELIKKSNKEWKYIVCRDRQRVEHIAILARELGIDIPFPVMLRELPIRNGYINSVLIDDIEDVIEHLVGVPVDFATTSCDVGNLENKSNMRYLSKEGQEDYNETVNSLYKDTEVTLFK